MLTHNVISRGQSARVQKPVLEVQVSNPLFQQYKLSNSKNNLAYLKTPIKDTNERVAGAETAFKEDVARSIIATPPFSSVGSLGSGPKLRPEPWKAGRNTQNIKCIPKVG